VSHLKERKEKHCLNCNATIHAKYCGVCGQENVQPQETAWHLITHIFNDITHFDGKFFSSLKYIFTKPGFLSSEYVDGRRMSYLNPIRFYLFTSAFFFFILFSFFVKAKNGNKSSSKNLPISKRDSLRLIKKAGFYDLDSLMVENMVKQYGIDSLKNYIENDTSVSKSNWITFSEEYKSKKEFDSLDKIGKVDIGFFHRKAVEKQFQLEEKYGTERGKGNEILLETILHYIPQMLFISVPFFALILKLLYIRRKKFYYVAHAIFTIHFYIFVYLQILLINMISKLAEITKQSWLYDITLLLGLGIIYYVYRAMRVFYEQSRRKTIAKLILLAIALAILFIIFAILLTIFSIYKM
jgi:hypothetical protein